VCEASACRRDSWPCQPNTEPTHLKPARWRAWGIPQRRLRRAPLTASLVAEGKHDPVHPPGHVERRAAIDTNGHARRGKPQHDRRCQARIAVVGWPAVVVNTASVAVGPISTSFAGLGFAILSDTCAGATLAGGAGCTISIRFTPVAAVIHQGTLVVSAWPGGAQGISLRGQGQ